MLKLKILDIAKKTTVAAKYNFLKSTLSWDRKKIEDFQLSRLHSLIKHAYTTVPYYRDLMQSLKLNPDDFKSVQDLIKLPVLDRETIRLQSDKLISTTSNKKDLQKGSSSGTSGIPISYYRDNDSLSSGTAALYTLWSMSGWKPGQKNVHVWGNASSIKRWQSLSSKLKNKLMAQLNVASPLLDNPENLKKIAEDIVKFNPVSIEGYPSSVYTLAEYFKKNNIKLPNLKQILTTAENLDSLQQAFLEKEFAPTSDLYGSGEVLGIASRPIGENCYYILDTHVIVETIESGIEGLKEVVVTDLDNYAMPFIRYKVGDMIDQVYQPDKNSKYQFSYFKKMAGRSTDIVILPNGRRFHPVNIFGGTLFRKYPEINRHRVIWNGKSLKFIFEIKNTFDYSPLETELKTLLKVYEIPFTIELTDKLLPSANGKFKYFEVV